MEEERKAPTNNRKTQPREIATFARPEKEPWNGEEGEASCPRPSSGKGKGKGKKGARPKKALRHVRASFCQGA